VRTSFLTEQLKKKGGRAKRFPTKGKGGPIKNAVFDRGETERQGRSPRGRKKATKQPMIEVHPLKGVVLKGEGSRGGGKEEQGPGPKRPRKAALGWKEEGKGRRLLT